MANYASGTYAPRNPNKYIGTYPITWRSSWELPMMKLFDASPNILQWASESISIPYANPMTRRWTMYKPDFLVVMIDNNNTKSTKIIEVKPVEEFPGYTGKVSKGTKLVQAVNAAKWAAAVSYCAKRNWQFMACTDKQMFAFQRKL